MGIVSKTKISVATKGKKISRRVVKKKINKILKYRLTLIFFTPYCLKIKTLEIVINEQETILSDLINNDSVSSNKNFLENHNKLEFEMNYYIKKYKRFKKQIFDIVENVMKQKEQKKLI